MMARCRIAALPPSTERNLARKFDRVLKAVEQLSLLNFKSLSRLQDVVERHIALTTLRIPDVGGVHTGLSVVAIRITGAPVAANYPALRGGAI